MTLADSALTHARLRAPQEDRTTLIEPPLETVPDLLENNRRLLDQHDQDLGGRTLSALAAEARGEFLRAAGQYTSSYRDVEIGAEAADGPIFLTGHQPTIFHPGVWFKNFVSGGLARRHAGVAVNLLIDSDTVRNTALRVPGGTVQSPTTRTVPFDRVSDEIPYEERDIVDQDLMRDFPRRVRQQIGSLIDNPLLADYWPLVMGRARATGNLGLSLAQGRHLLERDLGLTTLEIPQSHVCQLPSAHWLIAWILTELPRFHDIYNQTVRQYRLLHRIRSLNHPVPDLTADDGWLEAPFWVWQSSRPRRRGVFIRKMGGDLELSDRHGLRITLPRADGDVGSTAEALRELPSRGIKLRTRALGTTMLARLLLGDVFLHGIGGAKYDQLTDALIERFFKVEPPRFMVLSATLHLPVQGARATADDVHQVEQMLRELDYHPEQYVDSGGLSPDSARAVQSLIETKRQWVSTPKSQVNARRRHQEIRLANEGLQPWLEGQRRRLQSQREQLDRQLRAATTLTWREYGFCLYPKETLRDFYAGISSFQSLGYGP